MKYGIRSAAFLMAAYAVSTGALAHVGVDADVHQDIGLLDGVLHPLSGIDHLAAMLAVGFWSALGTRRVWLTPLAFAAMLLLGALAGAAGFRLAAVEPMIAASLLVLGLLVALQSRLNLVWAAALVGGFAVFHGLAHGAELGNTSAVWAPLLGMMLSTLTLHLVGLALGLGLRHQSVWWPRLAGATVALWGGALLLQIV